jgi:hypothetical protein
MPFMDEKERELFPKYQAILDLVDHWLRDNFQYRKPVATFALSVNHIITHRRKMDLYIRFLDQVTERPRPTIVIARIGFEKKRKGYGTAFLKLITDIALKYNYEYVELENCNHNSRPFADRFGFRFDIKDHPSCCRIEVDKLANHFDHSGLFLAN